MCDCVARSYVVCPSCHAVEPLTGKVMETMKACEPVICNACKEDEMRFKVGPMDPGSTQDGQGDPVLQPGFARPWP